MLLLLVMMMHHQKLTIDEIQADKNELANKRTCFDEKEFMNKMKYVVNKLS